jgi:hypothetical protein
MTMSDAHVVTFYLAQAHWMNFLSGLTALCIAYKMAFIIRQVPAKGELAFKLLRVMAAAVGTMVLVKAYSRFQGGDPAQWFDITRDILWCGFLFSSIFVLRKKLGNW